MLCMRLDSWNSGSATRACSALALLLTEGGRKRARFACIMKLTASSMMAKDNTNSLQREQAHTGFAR